MLLFKILFSPFVLIYKLIKLLISGIYFGIRNFFTFLKTRSVAKNILAVVYILSPFDFIPEYVFGAVGLADDAAVAVHLAVTAGKWLILRNRK